MPALKEMDDGIWTDLVHEMVETALNEMEDKGVTLMDVTGKPASEIYLRGILTDALRACAKPEVVDDIQLASHLNDIESACDQMRRLLP